MKIPRIAFLLGLFIATLLGQVRAESWPGFRFKTKITGEQKDEKSGNINLSLRIESDDPMKSDLAISYDPKTRKVTGAIWMTKGMFPLKMPSMGVYIPKRPATDSEPVVILSYEKLKGKEFSDVAFVNFIWKKSQSEQDAALKPQR